MMSLRGQHIFLLGTTRFDGPDQSTSYSIAKELSKENQVYYVDYPVTWKDYFKGRRTEQIRKRLPFFRRSSDGLINTEFHNLKVVITPPTLSINFVPEGFLYRTLLRINESIIRNRLKKVIQKFRINDFIFINSFNFHYPKVSDGLNPQLTVYHCVDPMIIPYDMKHGTISEEQLVRKSDLVICTSRQLFEEKIDQNPNTHFIPNAADLSQSSLALDTGLAIHPCLNGLSRPLIGYAGAIERRFDYELLHKVVNLNPDKSFVFAGPISREFVPDWFFETPNIVLPGRLPYSDMPGLMKGFDVAIIPFKRDEVSRTIFPLKLFEYLGAGKPVVSTAFNRDLEDYTQEAVSFCETVEHFSNALDEAYRQKDNQSMIQKRIAVAAQNTWEKRGMEVSDLLEKSLNEKTSQTDGGGSS